MRHLSFLAISQMRWLLLPAAIALLMACTGEGISGSAVGTEASKAASAPMATVLTPSTPIPTPTPTPIPGNRLSINGTLVGPGQVVVLVPYGTVMIYPSPREGGQFEPGQEVILGAYPRLTGSKVNWYGVDTSEATQAALAMTKTQYVIVEIIPTLGIFTPTPIPTPSPVSAGK